MVYWQVFTSAFLMLLFLGATTKQSSSIGRTVFLVALLSGMITGVFWVIGVIRFFGGI